MLAEPGQEDRGGYDRGVELVPNFGTFRKLVVVQGPEARNLIPEPDVGFRAVVEDLGHLNVARARFRVPLRYAPELGEAAELHNLLPWRGIVCPEPDRARPLAGVSLVHRVAGEVLA